MARFHTPCDDRLSMHTPSVNCVSYAEENPYSAIYEKIDGHLSATLESLYSRGDDIYERIATYRRSDAVRLAIGTDKILQAVVELVELERAYVFYLRRLKEGFLLPLTTYLSVSQRSCIFNNLEDLIKVHADYFDDIWDAFNGRHQHQTEGENSTSVPPACLRSIADAVVKRRSSFAGVYAVHVEGLGRALKALDEARKSDPCVNEQIEDCERDQPDLPDGCVPLEDRLRCPIQRFLKMPGPIGNIAKVIGKEHSEYRRVTEAHETLLDVNSYLEAVFLEAGEIVAGRFLKAEMSYNTLDTTEEAITIRYRLLHRGELQVSVKDVLLGVRSCFILGETLLICQLSETGGFDCTHAVPLADRYVETRESCLVWNLISQITMDEVTFYCKRDEERNKWVGNVKRAIKMAEDLAQPTFLRKKGHRYSSCACGSGSVCSICNSFFEGFHGRGLECEMCGTRAHAVCILKSSNNETLKSCTAVEPPTLKTNEAVHRDIIEIARTKIWFEADLLERSQIEACLMSHGVPNGTFFARFSSTLGSQSIVFSVKVDGIVKNLRVVTVRRKENGRSCIAFCVCEWIGFDSLDDVVSWYMSNPLLVSDEQGRPRGMVQFGIPYRVLPRPNTEGGSPERDSSIVHRRSKSEPTVSGLHGNWKKRLPFFSQSMK